MSVVLTTTGVGGALIELGLAIAGALIGTALWWGASRIARKRHVRVPRLDLAWFSMCNLVWLTATLGVYEVRITREFLGTTLGTPSRTTLGTLLIVGYALSSADRWRRRMDTFSRTAPIAAAVTAGVFTVWRGTFYGAGVAFVAASLFLIGYFQAKAFGRHTFGMAMFASALGGALAIAYGAVGVGELLLVLAGLIAGARSITAFLKGLEDRDPPPPASPTAVSEPSAERRVQESTPPIPLPAGGSGAARPTLVLA